MTNWLDDFTLDGEKLDLDITAAITSGRHVRSMSAASEVTIDVTDPTGVLLNSGVLAQKKPSKVKKFQDAAWDRLGIARALVEGEPYRLRGLSKTGSTYTLTFEPEIIALLSQHKRPVSASRNDLTRMQFIVRRLLSAVKERDIGWDIPDVSIKPKIEAPDRSAARKGLGKGVHALLNGQPLDAEQRRNVNLAMEAIEDTNAGDRASIALFEACIVEAPYFHNPIGGEGTSSGILQLIDTHLGGSTSTRGGRRDVKLVCKLFLTEGFTGKGGAIDLARKNPTWTPGMIAQACQGSGYPDRYEQHRGEADDLLAAAGGSGGFLEQIEQYRFRAGSLDGDPETYWQAILRLTDEVGRRAFVRDNLFVSAFDRDLLKRAPVLMVAEYPTDDERRLGVQPVGPIDFDWDVNKPVGTLSFTARADQLTAGPGDVIEVLRCGPAEGKWLIDEITDQLGRRDVTVDLVRPAPAKKEPASTVLVTSLPDSEAGGNARERMMAVCKRAFAQRSRYVYGHPRPIPTSLFSAVQTNIGDPNVLSAVTGRIVIDCSAFATLVYRDAGIEDPNGYDYKGAAWTASLWAHGQRTDRPQPGDLVFYGNPNQQNSHVNVYAGIIDGAPMAYNMGNAGLTLLKDRTVRPDFLGYRSYSLAPA